VERRGPITALVAAALGAILGFLALFLRELGWLLAAGGLTYLISAYVRMRRVADVGWLLLAAGASPGLILARNGLTSVLDPAVEVGIDTWIALAFASSVAAAGGLILYATWGRGTTHD
jgi:hypothetical protein